MSLYEYPELLQRDDCPQLYRDNYDAIWKQLLIGAAIPGAKEEYWRWAKELAKDELWRGIDERLKQEMLRRMNERNPVD